MGFGEATILAESLGVDRLSIGGLALFFEFIEAVADSFFVYYFVDGGGGSIFEEIDEKKRNKEIIVW